MNTGPIHNNAEEWQKALADVFPKGIPQTATWHDARAVATTLDRFKGESLSYVMLPVSGSMAFQGAQVSNAPGCIELIPYPNAASIVKVASLTYEHFPKAPWESFFLLECAAQKPTGLYPEDKDAFEEATELPNGKLVDRQAWNDGHFGRDEQGNAVPLPAGTRHVIRWLRGKLMIVSYFSWWNSAIGLESHDNGFHDNLSTAEIRAIIQKHLDRRRTSED